MGSRSETFWKQHEHGGFMDVRRYLKMVELFVTSGEVPDGKEFLLSPDRPWLNDDDPLLNYLIGLMKDPAVQAKVIGSKAAGKLFFSTVGRFIVDCLHATEFESKRTWTEFRESQEIANPNDSGHRRQWEQIVKEVAERHREDGFDEPFFRHLFSAEGGEDRQENWEKLQHDWQEAIFNQLRSKEERWIRQKQQQVPRQLDTAFRQMKDLAEKYDTSPEATAQALDMMEGTWSETEFERHLQVIKLRDRYPMLDEIIKKMGRQADDAGTDRLTSAAGTQSMMEHSAGSDIEGITIGNDVNALLPSEWAQCADAQMERLFVYKYLTHHLQVFHSRSNISKPVRHLNFSPARRIGPVVICVDTSASMKGLPERVERLLVEQLTATVQEEQRDCFFIDFSVSVTPIDLKARRYNRLLGSLGLSEKEMPHKEPVLPFLNRGTSALNMLETLFLLLDQGNYVNADVLWITDFDIPMEPTALARKMTDYQRTGTRFYGLKIADGDVKSAISPWEQYFNKVYTLKYRRLRRF